MGRNASTRPGLYLFHAVAWLMLWLVMGGCSWASRDGQRRYWLVVGLGVVETVEGDRRVVGDGLAARASRHDAAGIFAGVGVPVTGLAAGVISVQSVEVDPDANILIDAWTDSKNRLYVELPPLNTSSSQTETDSPTKETRP